MSRRAIRHTTDGGVPARPRGSLVRVQNAARQSVTIRRVHP
jgi:hypothetical protein